MTNGLTPTITTWCRSSLKANSQTDLDAAAGGSGRGAGAGPQVKPVLLGPVTYLWLGKVKGDSLIA